MSWLQKSLHPAMIHPNGHCQISIEKGQIQMIKFRSNEHNKAATVAGADLFADSESFLNELNDSEAAHIVGGKCDKKKDEKDKCTVPPPPSNLSLLLC